MACDDGGIVSEEHRSGKAQANRLGSAPVEAELPSSGLSRDTFTRTSDGHRIELWPIRLKWVRPLTPDAPRTLWPHRHLWQTCSERTPDGSTAFGMMPGYRKVYGQTWHFGRLKLCFGRPARERAATATPSEPTS